MNEASDQKVSAGSNDMTYEADRKRNPRRNRGWAFAATETALQSGATSDFQRAVTAVRSVGEGSKTSPRAMFEEYLANVALQTDTDTNIIASFGRQLLQTPFYLTGYTRGRHRMLIQRLRTHEPTTQDISDQFVAGAHIVWWATPDDDIVHRGPEPLALQFASRSGDGRPELKHTVPLTADFGEAARDGYTAKNVNVDVISVRVMPDETRAAIAGLATYILNNDNTADPQLPAEQAPSRIVVCENKTGLL